MATSFHGFLPWLCLFLFFFQTSLSFWGLGVQDRLDGLLGLLKSAWLGLHSYLELWVLFKLIQVVGKIQFLVAVRWRPLSLCCLSLGSFSPSRGCCQVLPYRPLHLRNEEIPSHRVSLTLQISLISSTSQRKLSSFKESHVIRLGPLG